MRSEVLTSMCIQIMVFWGYDRFYFYRWVLYPWSNKLPHFQKLDWFLDTLQRLDLLETQQLKWLHFRIGRTIWPQRKHGVATDTTTRCHNRQNYTVSQ